MYIHVPMIWISMYEVYQYSVFYVRALTLLSSPSVPPLRVTVQPRCVAQPSKHSMVFVLPAYCINQIQLFLQQQEITFTIVKGDRTLEIELSYDCLIDSVGYDHSSR